MSDSTIAPPITAAPNGATVASGDGTAANLGDGSSAANNASAADPQVVMPEGQASPVPAVSAQSFAAGAAAAVIPAAAPADTTVAKSAPLPPVMDLNNPEFYLNRELTWLAFNWRVLAEAEDRR